MTQSLRYLDMNSCNGLYIQSEPYDDIVPSTLRYEFLVLEIILVMLPNFELTSSRANGLSNKVTRLEQNGFLMQLIILVHFMLSN